MRQSNVIFATILFAFVIYITLRGQLSEYISLFTGASITPNASNNSSDTGNKAGVDWYNSVVNLKSLYSNTGIA